VISQLCKGANPLVSKKGHRVNRNGLQMGFAEALSLNGEKRKPNANYGYFF